MMTGDYKSEMFYDIPQFQNLKDAVEYIRMSKYATARVETLHWLYVDESCKAVPRIYIAAENGLIMYLDLEMLNEFSRLGAAQAHALRETIKVKGMRWGEAIGLAKRKWVHQLNPGYRTIPKMFVYRRKGVSGWPKKIVSSTMEGVNALIDAASQISGSHGEWTESDDVKNNRQKPKRARKSSSNIRKIVDSEIAKKIKGKVKQKVKQVASNGLTQLQAHGENLLHKYVHQVCNGAQGIDAVGLPSGSQASQLDSVTSYITMTSSATEGTAYCAFCPTTTSTGTAYSVSSASTYAGGAGVSFPASNATGTGITTGTMPFVYATGLSGPTKLARFVSAIIEVASVTAPLYEQGQIVLVVSPSNNNIAGVADTTLYSMKGAIVQELRKGVKYHIRMFPKNDSDTQYSTSDYGWGLSAGHTIAAVLVEGASSANPVSVKLKVTYTVEYAGPTVEHLSTPRVTPPVGGMDHCKDVLHRLVMHHGKNQLIKPLQLAKLGSSLLHEMRGTRGKQIISGVGTLLGGMAI